MPDDIILAYIAGFFDGEGSIGSAIHAGKNGNSVWMTLKIHQNDRSCLETIASDLERIVGVTGSITGSTPGHNKLSSNVNYSLQYQGGKGCAVAKALLPYVRVKQDYLKWYVFTWEHRWAEDEKTIDRVFFEQQHLNRPGRRVKELQCPAI
jgi:hypothetical protein